MKGTVFYKMTGSGNDFVMVDGRSTAPECWPADRIRALCDRRSGIGADGFVILTPQGSESVRMSYWNSDGSRAEMCGNAALCSGRLAADLELAAAASPLYLLTDAGPVHVHARAGCDVAEVSMPDADVPRPVPALAAGPGERWRLFTTVGVPHLVIRVADIEKVDVPGLGRELRQDPRLGPGGTNVNFIGAPSEDGLWPIRTYERGVEAETLACGTGTAAAGLALAAAGDAPLPVRFRSRGGLELQVRATFTDGRAHDIWLVGQSRLLFRGVWEG